MPRIEDRDLPVGSKPLSDLMDSNKSTRSELVHVLTEYLIKKSKQEREAKIKGPADHHI